ncbi:DnaJ domain-containing protein [Phenylobacterium sp.]|uniref:DnaJ domain-containing protein n=1 Tax=Phenylobacterium sp. TaxID=1871053 RepID=UPI003982DC81
MSDVRIEMTLTQAREVLGVGPLASPGEVRRAFRAAAKQAHPDRAGDEARFRQVVQAYHRLRAARPSADRIIQPPAATTPAQPGDRLVISPQVALLGGAADHLLANGRRVRIALPAGLRPGDRVRAGAAELTVAVRGDATIMVRGDDLWVTVAVARRTLDDGGRVALETPLGRRIVWITRKAGARGLVRLVGQGLPARGRHGQGHLFLRLSPQPGAADSAARTLLRRFAAAWAA